LGCGIESLPRPRPCHTPQLHPSPRPLELIPLSPPPSQPSSEGWPSYPSPSYPSEDSGPHCFRIPPAYPQEWHSYSWAGLRFELQPCQWCPLTSQPPESVKIHPTWGVVPSIVVVHAHGCLCPLPRCSLALAPSLAPLWARFLQGACRRGWYLAQVPSQAHARWAGDGDHEDGGNEQDGNKRRETKDCHDCRTWREKRLRLCEHRRFRLTLQLCNHGWIDRDPPSNSTPPCDPLHRRHGPVLIGMPTHP
jgi:hypothetical protein